MMILGVSRIVVHRHEPWNGMPLTYVVLVLSAVLARPSGIFLPLYAPSRLMSKWPRVLYDFDQSWPVDIPRWTTSRPDTITRLRRSETPGRGLRRTLKPGFPADNLLCQGQ